MMVSLPEIIRQARKELTEVTGLDTASTVEAVHDGEGWRVTVELVEKHSIPEGMDVLGAYAALMDDQGHLVEFRRKGLRKRMDTEPVAA